MKSRLLTRLNFVRVRMIKRIRFRRSRYVSVRRVGFKPSRSILTRLRSFRYWRGILVGVILIASSIWFLTQSEAFNITEIQFEIDGGARRFPQEEARNFLREKVVGSNIVFVDTHMIETSLLDNYRMLKFVKVDRNFPNALVILAAERKALLGLGQSDKLDGSAKNLLVDETGFVFAEAVDELVPSIKIRGPVSLYDTVSSRQLNFLIEVLQYLDSALVSDVSFGSTGLVDILFDETEIIFSSQKNAQDQIAALELIKTQYAIKDIKLSKIDLRFDRPVVVEKPTQNTKP